MPHPSGDSGTQLKGLQQQRRLEQRGSAAAAHRPGGRAPSVANRPLGASSYRQKKTIQVRSDTNLYYLS